MKAAVCLLVLVCGAYARLTITGPQAPVLQGDDVTLECLTDNDTDSSMDNYTFQKYSRYMKTWVTLDYSQYVRCWYYSVNISRAEDRLLMHLNDITEWQTGPYRCVKNTNQTDEEEVSEPLSVSVIYLQRIYLERLHSWYSTMSDIMYAEKGSTLEVKCSASASKTPLYEWSQEFSDWILPSDTLVIKNVNEESEGRYVCQARHPDMRSLVKTQSFQLQLLYPAKVRDFPVDFPVEEMSGLSFGDVLLFIAIPTVMLIVLVFTLLSILLRYRIKQMKKPQISLVDGEKKAPIYKGSLQSVCSTSSDTQPLVM